MKIIKASWEKRNIGKNTVEIILNNNDVIENFFLESLNNEYEYQVIKIPTYNILSSQKIQENAFRFIESQISLRKKVKDMNFNARDMRFLKSFSYERVEEENIFRLINLIDEEMFNTDRISIDLNLGPKIGSQRYKFWIQDLIKDSEIYFILMNNIKVGFFCLKEMEYSTNYILGGIFKKYKNVGIGLAMILFPIIIAKEKNKELITNISSNNFDVLKIYNYLNFEITAINNIFVKHTKLEGK